MRRSAKAKNNISQSCIDIMADAIKAKEQNLSYGKFKALDMMGAENLSDEEYTSEYTVHTTELIHRKENNPEKKSLAFVKIR